MASGLQIKGHAEMDFWRRDVGNTKILQVRNDVIREKCDTDSPGKNGK